MFTDFDIKMFKLAKTLSETSTHYKVLIGSVIVGRRDILSVGVNSSTKTHPMQKQYNRFRKFDENACRHLIHAEMDAIIKLKQFGAMDGLRIYSYRGMKDGSVGNCRPCPACFNALKDHGISDLFYTTSSGLCFEKVVDFKLN